MPSSGAFSQPEKPNRVAASRSLSHVCHSWPYLWQLQLDRVSNPKFPLPSASLGWRHASEEHKTMPSSQSRGAQQPPSAHPLSSNDGWGLWVPCAEKDQAWVQKQRVPITHLYTVGWERTRYARNLFTPASLWQPLERRAHTKSPTHDAVPQTPGREMNSLEV